ncbi:MAG: glutamate--tRNA ligase, partial [Arcobacter sp.]|nr:glutamate--tRNA ligase [Arcobacter sp.]
AILDLPPEYEPAGVKKFIKENTIAMLSKYCELLSGNDLHIPTEIEALTKPFISENGLKFPELFQPIRISLTGGTQAPSVYDIVAILGTKETIKRINSAIKSNFGR